jgi:hypothetical protein
MVVSAPSLCGFAGDRVVDVGRGWHSFALLWPRELIRCHSGHDHCLVTLHTPDIPLVTARK